MKKKFKRNTKKNNQRDLTRLNLFQVPKFQYKKKCPLTGKNAPEIDYKNIKLLKKYTSENGHWRCRDNMGRIFYLEESNLKIVKK